MAQLVTKLAGSDLKELWNTIYVVNSIEKMINGHAYSRAVHVNILIQICLRKLILNELDLTEECKITLKYHILSTDFTSVTLE